MSAAATAETGQPARAHHLPAVGAVVVAAGLLVLLPAVLGRAGLVVAVAVDQLALVAGWVSVAALEGSRASLALGALAALGADLALLLPKTPQLGDLLGVLGLGFLAVVVQQMLRRQREELVASLAGMLLLVSALCGIAAWLTLGRSAADRSVAVTAALAVATALVLAHLVDLVLPRPQITPELPRGLLALVVAVVGAAAVSVVRQGADTLADGLSGVIFGTVLGAVAVLISLAASYVVADTTTTDRPPPAWALPLVQALLPIAACGPVALALLRIL